MENFLSTELYDVNAGVKSGNRNIGLISADEAFLQELSGNRVQSVGEGLLLRQ
jgi:hypothetical protein